MEDAKLVFGWRNDPFIVERGSSQKTVTWNEHTRWFQATVSGLQRRMFIIEIEAEAAGQVRFDRIDDESCVVSAYLLERFTGQGRGVEAIRQGCERIFDEWPVARILACVRDDNAAGQTGFRKAGFGLTKPSELCRANHSTLILMRAVPQRRGTARP
jgi:RimJ/RimL family protein N-acetyltransferase